MKLQNTMLQTYGGFSLDMDKINCHHSTSKDSIELSYHGSMPEQFDGTSNARIRLNVQPTQCSIILKADKRNGKQAKAMVEATDAEIDAILNKLFFDKGQATPGCIGLDPYWEGIWTAHYIDWKKATRNKRHTSSRVATA